MPDMGRAVYGAILRGGYQAPPWARSGGGYERGGGTLGELIGRRGDIEAQGSLAGGQSLGNAINQIGQQAGAYFAERDQKREMAKRDAATMAAIESWDGQDPTQLFAGLQKIRPQDALQYTNAVLSLRKGPQKDPAQEMERFGKMAQFLGDQDDAVIARAWPHIRESFGSTAERLGLPLTEQWDPQARPLLGKIGEAFGPKKAKRNVGTLSPGGIAFDEDTGEIVAKSEKPKEGKVVETVDAQGRPITKEASPEELAAGVPKYVPPKAPASDPGERQMQWAIDPASGEERLMTNAEIRRAGGSRPATADMRNKAEGRVFVKRSIDAIKGLSQRVITKRGVAQRATAAGRTIESALGNDPEFRTYQDSRKALAGNLAVAQQGSRPSDADIQSIWLPMVPDVFRDTDESAKMKWDLINTMSLPEAKGGATGGGTLPKPKSRAEFDKLQSGAYYIDPNGVRRRKP